VAAPAPTPHAELPELRRELEALGYTAPEVGRQIGLREVETGLDYVSAASFPMLIVEPRPPSPAAILAHLFLAGGLVDAADLEGLFSRAAFRAVVDSGLVSISGAHARATVCLLPWKKLWIACGRREERYDEDYVFFPDRSTVVAAGYLTPLAGEPRARALDVGTGSGILALLLAERHGFERIEAVDVNPRALAFTRFAAAFNGVAERVSVAEVRPGDWMGPLDLVTFVLPQIYTVPIGKAIASHSPEGEKLIVETYQRVARALAPDGRAVLYHQSLRLPGRDVAAVIQAAGVPELQVVWRPTPAVYPEAAEFGIALIRRRRPGEPAFLRVSLPGRGLVLRREAIADHLESLAIADDETAFESARPVLVDGPAKVMLRVHDERLDDTGRLEIAGVVLPSTILPLLQMCSGERSVAEIAAEQPAQAPTRKALRSLVEVGILNLRVTRPG
jgi:SAM-dependent methyltransferase